MLGSEKWLSRCPFTYARSVEPLPRPPRVEPRMEKARVFLTNCSARRGSARGCPPRLGCTTLPLVPGTGAASLRDPLQYCVHKARWDAHPLLTTVRPPPLDPDHTPLMAGAGAGPAAAHTGHVTRTEHTRGAQPRVCPHKPHPSNNTTPAAAAPCQLSPRHGRKRRCRTWCPLATRESEP